MAKTSTRIDKEAFKNITPKEEEQTLSDGGGLFLRIRALKDGGATTFRFCYRFEGKQRWLNLETKMAYDVPKRLRSDILDKAREEHAIYKAWVKQGKDPSLERDLKKERAKQQQLAEQEVLTKLKARVTVSDLFTRWVDTDLINRKDHQEIIRMFNKDVLPVLGGLFVEDVRKGHITQVTDALLVRGVAHLARNILKLMRQMFRFAVDRDIIEFDPTASLSVVRLTTSPTERDRVLSEEEIRALARQLPGAGFMKSTECAVWVALSTMCRIGELSKAQWADVDVEAGIWRIPEEHSKNGKAHTIYLSDFAREQFRRLATFRQSDTWLFPNRDNSGHVCDKSISIQVRGRQTATILSGRSKDSQALVLTGGKWTPHDLRRTGATLMGDLGVMRM